jgi:hypothetical protein
VNLFQAFEDLESVKDKEAGVKAYADYYTRIRVFGRLCGGGRVIKLADLPALHPPNPAQADFYLDVPLALFFGRAVVIVIYAQLAANPCRVLPIGADRRQDYHRHARPVHTHNLV